MRDVVTKETCPLMVLNDLYNIIMESFVGEIVRLLKARFCG